MALSSLVCFTLVYAAPEAGKGRAGNDQESKKIYFIPSRHNDGSSDMQLPPCPEPPAAIKQQGGRTGFLRHFSPLPSILAIGSKK